MGSTASHRPTPATVAGLCLSQASRGFQADRLAPLIVLVQPDTAEISFQKDFCLSIAIRHVVAAIYRAAIRSLHGACLGFALR